MERNCDEKALSDLLAILYRDNDTFLGKIKKALQLSNQYYGTEYGVVSRIRGGDYHIIECAAPPNSLNAGDFFPLKDTYCMSVLEADYPVFAHYVKETEISFHPCYELFGMDTYIGAPVKNETDKFGTVCFAATSARHDMFTSKEESYLQTLADWLSDMMPSYVAEIDQTLDNPR